MFHFVDFEDIPTVTHHHTADPLGQSRNKKSVGFLTQRQEEALFLYESET